MHKGKSRFLRISFAALIISLLSLISCLQVSAVTIGIRSYLVSYLGIPNTAVSFNTSTGKVTIYGKELSINGMTIINGTSSADSSNIDSAVKAVLPVAVRDYINSYLAIPSNQVGYNTSTKNITAYGKEISIANTANIGGTVYTDRSENIDSAVRGAFTVAVRDYLTGSLAIPSNQVGYNTSTKNITVCGKEISIANTVNIGGTVYTDRSENIDSAVRGAFPVAVRDYLTGSLAISSNQVGYNTYTKNITVCGKEISIANTVNIGGTVYTDRSEYIVSAVRGAFPVAVRDYLTGSLVIPSNQVGYNTSTKNITVYGKEISIAYTVNIGGTIYTDSSANIDNALKGVYPFAVRDYLIGSLAIPSNQVGYNASTKHITVCGKEISVANTVNIGGTIYTDSSANIDNAVKGVFTVAVRDYLTGSLAIPENQVGYNTSTKKITVYGKEISIANIVNIVGTIYTDIGLNIDNAVLSVLNVYVKDYLINEMGVQDPNNKIIGYNTTTRKVTLLGKELNVLNTSNISGKIYTDSGTNILNAVKLALPRNVDALGKFSLVEVVDVRDYIKKITNLTDSDITGQGTAISVLGQSITIEGIIFDTAANTNYAQPENIKSALTNRFNVQVRKYLEGIICPGIGIGYANNKVTLNGIELNISSLINIEGTAYTTSEANILNAVKEKLPNNISNNKLVRAEPKISVSNITGNSVTVSTVYPYPGNPNNYFQFHNLTTGAWYQYTSGDGYGLDKSYVIGGLTPDTEYTIDLNWYENQQWKCVSTKIHTSVNVRDYIKKIANLTDSDITGQGTDIRVLGQSIAIGGIAFDTVANANYAPPENIKSALTNKFNVQVRQYLEGIICPGIGVGYSNNKVTLNGIELNISSLININGTTYTTSEANILNAVKEKFPNNISNNKLVRAEPKITVSGITGNSVTVSTVYPYPGNPNNYFQFHNLTTGAWTHYTSGDGYGLDKSYVINGLTPDTVYTIDLNWHEDQQWKCVSTKIHTSVNVRDYIKKITNLTDADITGQGTDISVLKQPIVIEGIVFDEVAQANYAPPEKIKNALTNTFKVQVRKYLEGIVCPGIWIGYANNKVTLSDIELNISNLINIENMTYTTSEANILNAVKEKLPNNISNNKLVRAEPKITVSNITGNSATVSTVYPYPRNGNNHFQFHNLTTGAWSQYTSGDGYGLDKSYVINGLTPDTEYTIDLNWYEDQKWKCVSTKIRTASTPTVTLSGTKSLTILRGQSANLEGLITSSANIEKVTIGVKEVNIDCYESIVSNNTSFDLNSFKIDTINALTPSGKNNPFVNMGSYTLTVWAKIAGSDAIKLGEISLKINVAGIGNRAARTNLMKLVSLYPSIFKYKLEINDEFGELNSCLLDFASKYNLTGSYSKIEELEDKLQQAADGTLPLPGIGNRAARTNLVKLKSLYPSMFKYDLGIDDTFDGYLNSCLADFAGKFELSGKYTKIEELEFYLQQAADGKIKPNSGGDSTYWRQKIVDEAGYWINKISYQMPSSYDYKTGTLDKNSPPSSLDCSDFTSALYATVLGTRFVDYTGNQLNVGTGVDMTKAKSGDYSALKPGDLIIFDWPTNGTTPAGDHVAIYVGGSKDPNGKLYPDGAYIHESSGAGSVAQATLSADWGEKYGVVHTNIIGIRRVIQDDNTYINNPSDGAKALPGSASKYTYVDKDGNKVTKDWTISDDDFVNANSLTQAQITSICKSKNSALIDKGVDTAIYKICQDKGINPKVILATLGQEQSWGLNGSYDKLFGIGPEGKPISYSNIEWQIAGCADIYLKYYNVAKSLIQKNGKLAPQTKNIDDTGAYAGYEAAHPVYGEFMKKGQQITSVNAAMYSKLTYTPWVDFPPQNSHPLDDWLNIYNSFK